MGCIRIYGGHPLNGEVVIQGSKNAALPILAGAVLHKGSTVLHNCPKISDVSHMIKILEEMGCRTSWTGNTLFIDAGELDNPAVSREFGEKMRCSVIFLGALLGRMGTARIPYPGGCTIGARPIDMHVDALHQMKAKICEECEYLSGKREELVGTRIRLRFPSVGATENIILAAVLAKGTTEILGSAREPEIEELCRFLNGKGARIQGAGTGKITIEGVEKLSDSEFCLMPDRIVAGTYLMASIATRGICILKSAPAVQLKSVFAAAVRMGALISVASDDIRVDARGAGGILPVVDTAPHPGFPTDLQSQLMAALCLADGESHVREKVFECRFRTAKELIKMGAEIEVKNCDARIHGVRMLHGARVKAPELRGGAALVLAGAAAQGKTLIEDCHYIERGYEDICRDMRQLGADIEKCEDV
ncbi:MAG: UDP-N-acetylglucosamine 1-carboxyvinyltransferase [Blautia sp.]|nr:UDP-N-acetylglucosamine 1-carboxyvinyltransferase [Blautia sp.]MDY4516357.1 UDP-N-acetylglucosamine 1-carboxyvinyltransferase [Lachnospiraceae bacterium]